MILSYFLLILSEVSALTYEPTQILQRIYGEINENQNANQNENQKKGIFDFQDCGITKSCMTMPANCKPGVILLHFETLKK
jgi:hypothetical protein